MADQIEKYHHSTIQHGKSSDRIYLMKLDRCDLETIPYELQILAKEKNYSKLFCKVPAWGKAAFENAGFEIEGSIPGFFKGETSVLFMSKFLKTERLKQDPDIRQKMDEVLAVSRTKIGARPDENSMMELTARLLNKADAPALARLYRQVFDSYPFPIFDPAYLVKTMETHIRYAGVFSDGHLVAAASAEMDKEAQNAEMTDFATHPDFRGRNLSWFLLDHLESEMKVMGMKTLYTIARSVSTGMNVTFARHRYIFTGTLINNTQISGKIESMNVWYKSVDAGYRVPGRGQ